MSLRNSKTQYGSVAKFFHWTIAIGIIGLLICGLLMDDLTGQLKMTVYTLHKSFGLLILVLAVLRTLWRLGNPSPAMPQGTSPMVSAAAWVGHGALYLVMFVMPLSGWIMSTAVGHPPEVFWLFTARFPGVAEGSSIAWPVHAVHVYVGYAAIALITLHVLAALYHHIVKGDDVLTRMTPGSK